MVLELHQPLVLLEVLVLEHSQLALLQLQSVPLLLVLAMLMRHCLPLSMLGGCGILGPMTLVQARSI